jgi:hypothetical protein
VSHRILVPVEILEGEDVPEALFAALAPMPVVVLGYHVLPEQTPPGQARLQFEDRAQKHLSGIADLARAAGCEAETRLVFTHEEEQTVRRVAAEANCDAILVPNPTASVESVLVSLRGGDDPELIGEVVAAFAANDDFPITLLHVAREGETAERRWRAQEQLVAGGVDADRIDSTSVTADAPVSIIAEVAADHDLVVMGETAPSFREYVFGEDHQRVADRSLGPVLVVGVVGDR